jgi:integrase
MKLTQVAVERVKPPATGRVEYWDTQLPGFGLRLSDKGGRTWTCMYRVGGKLVRETIGTLALIPKVDEARERARQSMRKASDGVNPIEERQRAEEEEHRQVEAEAARQRDTMGAAIDRYLERYAVKRMRPEYYKETERTLRRDVVAPLGARPIREITRREIRELIESVVDRGSPSHANHVLAYLRAMLNWAVSNDLIEASPCDGLKMPAPLVERDRALNDDEIRLFWRGCDAIGWPFGPLFQLLLLTGQRRDEMAEARWSEFDLDKALWTLPRERAKNNKSHLIHLSPLAIEILGTLPKLGSKGLLFTTTGDTSVSGFGRARDRLATVMRDELRQSDPAGEIQPFTLHDLRRTAATGMAGLGIAHHVLDRILNHVAGKISGVAAIYNRHEYLAERKSALDAWARHVEGLVLSVPSNVTDLASVRRGEKVPA